MENPDSTTIKIQEDEIDKLLDTLSQLNKAVCALNKRVIQLQNANSAAQQTTEKTLSTPTEKILH